MSTVEPEIVKGQTWRRITSPANKAGADYTVIATFDIPNPVDAAAVVLRPATGPAIVVDATTLRGLWIKTGDPEQAAPIGPPGPDPAWTRWPWVRLISATPDDTQREPDSESPSRWKWEIDYTPDTGIIIRRPNWGDTNQALGIVGETRRDAARNFRDAHQTALNEHRAAVDAADIWLRNNPEPPAISQNWRRNNSMDIDATLIGHCMRSDGTDLWTLEMPDGETTLVYTFTTRELTTDWTQQ